jgi:maltose/moltooligosaccharide transporter
MSAFPTDEQTPEQSLEAAPPLAGRPPGLATTVYYSAANLGYGMFYALNNAILTLYVQHRCPGVHPSILGLMGSSHSIEGTVVQPLVGAASDQLRTRYGRRRPFMLIFTPLSALFLLLTPAAGHLPISLRLAGLVGCIFLFTVCFNVAADPYQALMPDVFPADQRGRVMGISMFVLVLGQVLVLMAPVSPEAKFGLTAIIMMATTLLTCATIREPAHPAPEAAHSHWDELRMALRGLGTLRQARLALIALFLSGIGIGAVTPFLTVFVQTITRCSDAEATKMYMVLTVFTALGVLPFGWLSDRIGPKSVLILGLGLLSLAAINGLWVTSLGQITIVLIVAGLGNAAQSASAYPLLTRLVPGEETGFYTGLQSTALSLAQPLTALITGNLIKHGGYRWIFAVCSFSICAALAVLAVIRTSDAGQEVAERDRQQGRAAQGV